MTNKKKLNQISWIAAAISITGVALNAYQIIWCWPIWCLSNGIWIYYSIKTKQTSQIVLWIVFTIANFFGWYQWHIN